MTSALVAIIAAGVTDGAPARPARLPDAEIFATNNVAVITDPDDPRLDDQLRSFDRRVKRIIRDGGGEARRSRLLDGVFFSSSLQATTLERSRDFDVDSVTRRELHDIAERIRRHVRQQAVLTFDYPERRSDPRDAVEVELAGLSTQRLREGLLADAEARERLSGGSVTVDGRLVLIASRKDLGLVKRFVTKIGGDVDAAAIRTGHREFVG